jgi:hypothetical protein
MNVPFHEQLLKKLNGKIYYTKRMLHGNTEQVCSRLFFPEEPAISTSGTDILVKNFGYLIKKDV